MNRYVCCWRNVLWCAWGIGDDKQAVLSLHVTYAESAVEKKGSKLWKLNHSFCKHKKKDECLLASSLWEHCKVVHVMLSPLTLLYLFPMFISAVINRLYLKRFRFRSLWYNRKWMYQGSWPLFWDINCSTSYVRLPGPQQMNHLEFFWFIPDFVWSYYLSVKWILSADLIASMTNKGIFLHVAEENKSVVCLQILPISQIFKDPIHSSMCYSKPPWLGDIWTVDAILW